MTKRASFSGESADDPLPRRSRLGDVRENAVYRVKAEMFRTLGHPVRLRVLELLAQGESTVSALQSALDLDSSGVSQHLSALRRHGLLQSRKVGTSVYCSLRDHRALEMLTLAGDIVATKLQGSQLLLCELDESTDPRPGVVAARTPRAAPPPQDQGR